MKRFSKFVCSSFSKQVFLSNVVDHNISQDESEPTTNKSNNAVPLDLPKTAARRSLVAECRDLLDRIKSLTFSTHKEDVLRKLGSQLQSTYRELIAAAHREDGLVVEEVATCNQKKMANKRANENLTEARNNLPLPPKRVKTNRIGISADKKREQATYFLNVETGKLGNYHFVNLFGYFSTLEVKSQLYLIACRLRKFNKQLY